MSYTLNNIKRSPFKGLDYSVVTSDFGPRSFWNPITNKQENNTHHGIDLTSGTTVVAVADGTVTAARNNIEGYTETYSSGNYVTISHGNGIYTTYCHMVKGSVKVSVGQKVTAGTELGTKGSTGWSTGPHLHFGVMEGSTWVDPKPYLLGTKAFPGGTAEPTVSGNDILYTVVYGDTLSSIASRYGTTYQALASYNGIANPNIINVGQVIRIPNTSKPTPQPQPSTDLLDLVRRTIRGDFGNGENRARALGSNYAEVQRQVNLNYKNGTTSWNSVRIY